MAEVESKQNLTHGELFAGIGGFGLGFDRTDIKTIWHVEIDKNCQNILRRHNPGNLILADIRDAGKDNLPYVDIISFGSPCQDLSIAGKRKGIINGKRSSLFFEATRIVGELQPVFAVWENVPGALSSNSGRDFAAVLSAFRECGARDIAWRILDAQYFGIPQRRRRIFLIADFRGERASQILFERESSPGDTPPSREKGQEIAYSLRANPSHSGDKGDGGINTTLIAKSLSTNPADRLSGEDNYIVGMLHNGTPGRDASDAADNKLIAWNWQSGGDVRFDFNEKPMLQASQVPAIGVRRLTPKECSRLQGFPDGWNEWGIDEKGNRIEMSDSTRYRQLGNAVAIPVVEWIGRRIVNAGS